METGKMQPPHSSEERMLTESGRKQKPCLKNCWKKSVATTFFLLLFPGFPATFTHPLPACLQEQEAAFFLIRKNLAT
jgi:hypothetical protein